MVKEGGEMSWSENVPIYTLYSIYIYEPPLSSRLVPGSHVVKMLPPSGSACYEPPGTHRQVTDPGGGG